MGDEQTRNESAFRRLIDEGFSGGNVAIADELCSADFVEHQDGMDDRDGVKSAIGFIHALSPDVRVTVEDLTASGDRVWARLRARGTHSGPALGGPTGVAFDICVMDVCRFREGLIVEHWGVPDRLAQMRQLGLLALGPRPAEGAG